MVIFEFFYETQSLIQIYTKRIKLQNNLNNSRGGGGMPRSPPSKAHGFAMRSMQISRSEKDHSCPPIPNPGYAPAYTHTCMYLKCHASKLCMHKLVTLLVGSFLC